MNRKALVPCLGLEAKFHQLHHRRGKRATSVWVRDCGGRCDSGQREVADPQDSYHWYTGGVTEAWSRHPTDLVRDSCWRQVNC